MKTIKFKQANVVYAKDQKEYLPPPESIMPPPMPPPMPPMPPLMTSEQCQSEIMKTY